MYFQAHFPKGNIHRQQQTFYSSLSDRKETFIRTERQQICNLMDGVRREEARTSSI